MLGTHEIYKAFNTSTINGKRVMDGVTFTLNEGGFATVIGDDGVGKFTLLNLMVGTYPVNSDSIAIGGQDVTRLPGHRRARFIGRVSQNPMMGTTAIIQIKENLALATRWRRNHSLRLGIIHTEREQYWELLKTLDLGLEDRLTGKVGLLSGGQRWALTLLIVALRRPQFLLLDEHTAALDPKTTVKALDVTEKTVQRDKLTTLVITHSMCDAITHGDHLIMLYDGRVVVDITGEGKKKLIVEQLLAPFGEASGLDEAGDKLLLSQSLAFPSQTERCLRRVSALPEVKPCCGRNPLPPARDEIRSPRPAWAS